MTEEEFKRLRDRIVWEASDATDHLSLLKRLVAARSECALEMNVSLTFWNLTMNAHWEAALSRVCKLYDKARANLSLKRFLEAVQNNARLFSDEAFRARLKDNPYVDMLVAGRAINLSQIPEDIKRVSAPNPLAIRLKELRNKDFMHIDVEQITQGNATARLPLDGLEALLHQAREITLRYSLLYDASVPGGIVGVDDCISMLQCVRKALVEDEAEIEDEMKRVMALAV